jgi:hypothetical protein
LQRTPWNFLNYGALATLSAWSIAAISVTFLLLFAFVGAPLWLFATATFAVMWTVRRTMVGVARDRAAVHRDAGAAHCAAGCSAIAAAPDAQQWLPARDQ